MLCFLFLSFTGSVFYWLDFFCFTKQYKRKWILEGVFDVASFGYLDHHMLFITPHYNKFQHLNVVWTLQRICGIHKIRTIWHSSENSLMKIYIDTVNPLKKNLSYKNPTQSFDWMDPKKIKRFKLMQAHHNSRITTKGNSLNE